MRGVEVTADRCPNCGAPNVEAGGVTKDGISGSILVFTPYWHRFAFFRWRKGVEIMEPFYACSSCGFLWSRIDGRRLRSFIERYGTADAKRALVMLTKLKAEDELG
jgi:hypothetical protein